jgi:predicted HTH transcriptional regulator
MNSQILKAELLKLLPIIQILHGKERLALAFDRTQLDVPFELPQETRELQKGQETDIFYKKTESFNLQKDKNKSHSDNGQINNGQSTREVMILDILKNKGEVGIRDITSIIRGVSSKTVQRDLNVLLSRGLLKKTGERRWSKYSLVSS